jgi:Asp/Glu/hydantoin racemase
MRIWYQSFTHPEEGRPYAERLSRYLAEVARPDTAIEVHSMTPPSRRHRISEYFCGGQAIRNAVAAERQGYDAFVIGHFQDSGLYEARAATSLPVLGLGEAAMLYACTLGQRIALITINPIFIPFHEEQVVRYRLENRVVAVAAVQTSLVDYVRALEDDAAYAALRRQYQEQIAPLGARGVEVIVLAGGLPALLLARESDLGIPGAVTLNALPVVVKMAEMAVDLKRLNGTATSRRSTFAPPSPEAIRDFLS